MIPDGNLDLNTKESYQETANIQVVIKDIFSHCFNFLKRQILSNNKTNNEIYNM